MFLEFLKYNFLTVAILSLVILNYLLSLSAKKSLLLVFGLCLVTLFDVGLRTERDLFYLFTLVFVFSATYFSETKDLVRENKFSYWQKSIITIVVFLVVWLGLYLETKYSIKFKLQDPLRSDLLLFAIVFLPTIVVLRKAKR